VKSNIGHPEAAGGLAGLIKTALVVRERRIPATVHCPDPTSAVDWAGLGIALASSQVEWPFSGRALAGVSTYGLSGTFVHLVVGEL
jgi:acyl transferase domain-containing protein